MLRDIKNGSALLIEPRTKRLSVYAVRIHRQFEWVYVLSNGKDVFTAWPPTRRMNEIRRRIHEPEIVLRVLRIVDENGG